MRLDTPPLAAFALVAVALFYVAYFRTVRAGGAALAAILLYTAPAWVALGAALWLRERITPRTLAALVLTVGGVALVALAGGGTTGDAERAVRLAAPALGWGLVAGLAYAAYYLVGKRYVARSEPPTVFAYALPAAALALWPAVRFAPKAALTWATIAFIAVVPTYRAYLVYGIGLRRVDATRAATVATLEPVVAAGLAYAFWGEALGALGYVGAALVLAGVLAATAGPAAREAS